MGPTYPQDNTGKDSSYVLCICNSRPLLQIEMRTEFISFSLAVQVEQCMRDSFSKMSIKFVELGLRTVFS
jgi:hypothetical protein